MTHPKKMIVTKLLLKEGLSISDIKSMFEMDWDWVESDSREIADNILSEVHHANALYSRCFQD